MEYKIEMMETDEQPAVVVRTVTSVKNLQQVIGEAYDAIIAYLNEIGEQPADAPYVAYFNMDMENLDVEMGFPVKSDFPGKGNVKGGKIPAGKKVTVMHKGSYTDSAAAYDVMNQWVVQNGYEPTGTVYEFYLNSPEEVPESELLTKIVFLLR